VGNRTKYRRGLRTVGVGVRPGGALQPARLAAEHQLPAIPPLVEFAQAGGLMAGGPNATRRS